MACKGTPAKSWGSMIDVSSPSISLLELTLTLL